MSCKQIVELQTYSGVICYYIFNSKTCKLVSSRQCLYLEGPVIVLKEDRLRFPQHTHPLFHFPVRKYGDGSIIWIQQNLVREEFQKEGTVIMVKELVSIRDAISPECFEAVIIREHEVFQNKEGAHCKGLSILSDESSDSLIMRWAAGLG
jgi:hypothetical protein